jgi:hypothetical protein
LAEELALEKFEEENERTERKIFPSGKGHTFLGSKY